MSESMRNEMNDLPIVDAGEVDVILTEMDAGYARLSVEVDAAFNAIKNRLNGSGRSIVRFRDGLYVKCRDEGDMIWFRVARDEEHGELFCLSEPIDGL